MFRSRAVGWTSSLAAICVAIAGCTRAANPDAVVANPPIRIEGQDLVPAELKRALAAKLAWKTRGSPMGCSYALLGQRGREVYLWARCDSFVEGRDALEDVGGVSLPVVVTVDPSSAPVRVVSIATPGDGDANARDIGRMFPREIAGALLADDGRAGNRRARILLEANCSDVAATLTPAGKSLACPSPP